MERWKKVIGMPFFEVSNKGNVRSMPRVVMKKIRWGYVVPHNKPGRVLAPKPNRHGYLRISLRHNGITKIASVHQLVLESFVRPRKEGEIIRHMNGVKTDNRLINLKWGTPAQNSADRERHGTMCLGESHSRSKLTDEAVREIRATKEWPFGTLTRLAKKLGVKKSTILFVKKGDTWRHVK